MVLLPKAVSSLLLLNILLSLSQIQQSQSYAFTNSIQSQSIVLKRGAGFAERARKKIYNASIISSSKEMKKQGLQMKDLSSANAFQIGDEVRVVSSVIKAGVDLNDRVGTVEETWEKCDVDPTCCCAEFVDEHFAVTVRFDGSIDDVSGKEVSGTKDIFTHFFSEDELIKT